MFDKIDLIHSKLNSENLNRLDDLNQEDTKLNTIDTNSNNIEIDSHRKISKAILAKPNLLFLKKNLIKFCSQTKRLKKKSLLVNTNSPPGKYLKQSSCSASSSSSSLSSSSVSTPSSPNPSLKNKTTSKFHKQPMKLHRFYHSVPFKCPFCFTFKELPSDFIEHLAVNHFSDVKNLYERKLTKLTDDSITTPNYTSNDEGKGESKENSDESSILVEENNRTKINDNSNEVNENINNKHSLTDNCINHPKQDENVNCNNSGIISPSNVPVQLQSNNENENNRSLPPRKQQRLLKTPLNEPNGPLTQTNEKQIEPKCDSVSKQSDDYHHTHYHQDSNINYLNYYYQNNQKQSNNSNNPSPTLTSNNNFAIPSSPFFQANDKTNFLTKNLTMHHSLNSSTQQQQQQQQQPQQQQAKQISNNVNNGNSNNKATNNCSVGEASMKCAICDRGFEYYSNLRRHIKTKHKIFGKQVKEYVIRHNNGLTNPSGNQIPRQKPVSNNLYLPNNNDPKNESFNNNNNNNSEMQYSSPSSSPGSTISSNNTTNLVNGKYVGNEVVPNLLPNMMMMNAAQQTIMSNYGALKNLALNQASQSGEFIKTGSNGKNSPLSSMSSSSICSKKSQVKEENCGSNNTNSNNNDESLDDEMEQAEVASSVSSASINNTPTSLNTSNYSHLHQNQSFNATVAAIAAAAAQQQLQQQQQQQPTENQNASPLPLNHQISSILNNHGTLSKLKSSIFESILSRKLSAGKFLPNGTVSGSENSSMASITAAVVAAAASMTNQLHSSNDEQNNNINKFIQNLVEMNQMHHYHNAANNNQVNLRIRNLTN